MLGKLLKHEFRATARIMLPVYLLLMATAGLFNLFMHLANSYDVAALEVFRGISSFLFVIALAGTGVVTLCLMVYRFYKNLMTEEGYLMFTLPVSTPQLIWSKLITALVWTLASFLVIWLAVFTATLGMGVWQEVLTALRAVLNAALTTLSTGHLVALGIEVAVLAILSCLSSFLMFYAAIAAGHSASNHKILFSVGFYFLFNIILQIVSSFAGIYGIVGLAQIETGGASADPVLMAHIFLLGSVAAVLLTAVIFYLITRYCMRKRLNLQ